MRILLPPSEAKAPGGHAGSDDRPSAFDNGRLTGTRASVAAALVELCAGDPAVAALALALPARSSADDVAAGRVVLTAPTRPALDRYAGTVYEGLVASTLTAAGRRRALESVLIFSGLFGVLRADELVPAYRLPVTATLPTVGALTPFWREALRDDVATLVGDDLIVDLRSSDYAAMWRPTGSAREQVVSVRVVSEQSDGRLAVISYFSKHGKGRLARALVSSRARVTSVDQIAQLWTVAGGRDAMVHAGGRLELVT